jgi:hypothetical protein
VTAEHVEQMPVGRFSPAGAWLPRPAKLIPHETLRPIEELISLPVGQRAQPAPKERGPDESQVSSRIEELIAQLHAIAVHGEIDAA